MVREKKIFPVLPEPLKLHDAQGDLSKRWYIYWTCPREQKRKRRYSGLDQYGTLVERYQAAKLLAEELHPKIFRKQLPDEPPVIKALYKHLRDRQPFLAKTTFQTYSSKVNILAKWWNKRPGVVTHELAKSFMLYLAHDRKAHKTTWNSYLATFKELWNGTFPRIPNPWEGIEFHRDSKTSALYFQSRQIAKIKSKISECDPQLWLFVEFMYYTFIRPRELRQLKISDLLLDEHKILIRSQVSKNRKQQYVAIPAPFRPSLQFLHAYPESDYIFSHHGQPGPDPIGERSMNRRHQVILKELNFDTTRHKLYSWKHTGCVMAVKNGITVKDLQLQLRHHSLDQVNQYLRDMGVLDSGDLVSKFPEI